MNTYKKTIFNGTRGRTAVITGASGGIGAAFSRRLAAEGFDLVIIARRKELLDRLAEELEAAHGVKVAAIKADLSGAAGLRAVEKRLSAIKNIDVLVNNAGFGTRGFFADVLPEKSDGMVQLHVAATVRLTRLLLPGMIANRRGFVINVSSLGAFLTTSHYTVYSATKAFINMLVLGLKDELAGTGVRAMAICPGLTMTGFMHTDEFSDFDYGKIPRFAWMTPEEVVDESLAALRRGAVIFIPGRGNRIFVGMLKAPVFGTIFGALLSLLGRGKNAY